MLAEIIGGLAALTSTISLLPQITKVMSTRSTSDLSYLMLANFLLTSVLWFFYGLIIQSTSISVCNAIMTAMAAFLLTLKYRFG